QSSEPTSRLEETLSPSLNPEEEVNGLRWLFDSKTRKGVLSYSVASDHFLFEGERTTSWSAQLEVWVGEDGRGRFSQKDFEGDQIDVLCLNQSCSKVTFSIPQKGEIEENRLWVRSRKFSDQTISISRKDLSSQTR